MGKNKIILLIILFFFLASCGSYTISSYHPPKIKSLLAITEAGDTVSVSIREFEKQKYDTYTRFNYNNNWYWNNWRYNYNWWGQQPFFAYPNRYWYNNRFRYINPSRDYRIPSRPQTQPKTRPKNQPPRTRPRFREPNERVRVNTPRGSNNQYTPRNNNNSNVRTRVNVGRGSTGGRRNNQ